MNLRSLQAALLAPTQSKEKQTAKILKLLKSKGQATNHELERICYRYGARVYDLRTEGWIIVTEHVKGPTYRYILKGHSDDSEAAL